MPALRCSLLALVLASGMTPSIGPVGAQEPEAVLPRLSEFTEGWNALESTGRTSCAVASRHSDPFNTRRSPDPRLRTSTPLSAPAAPERGRNGPAVRPRESP